MEKNLRIKVELKNKNESEIKYLLKISINKYTKSIIEYNY